MKQEFITGNSIYLRRIETEDLVGNYFNWFNDREVTRWTQHGIFPNTSQAMEKYYESVSHSKTDLVLAIILQDDHRHVGNIGIHRIHPIFRSAEVGILIGEKDVWGQGIGTQSIQLMVSHAFLRLNLHRLYAGAVIKNLGCIRAFEKVGFIREGMARQAYFCEGEYLDCINLSLLQSDWLMNRKSEGDRNL